MAEEQVRTGLSSRLLHGEKVLCIHCGQDYYVTDAEDTAKAHGFYCPNCDSLVNIDFVMDIVVKKMSDESGGYFFAEVLELPGCQSDGDTVAEAYANVFDAMRGYIETKLENGVEVPIPKSNEKYSGKFVLRIPKSLHRSLTVAAEREGVSLNQYALYKLSI